MKIFQNRAQFGLSYSSCFITSFCLGMNILDTIVEQKRLEVAKLPERLIAAGDLRDAMLEHGEQRDFLAALRQAARGRCGLDRRGEEGVAVQGRHLRELRSGAHREGI
jgi:hypothetical protein